MKKNSYKGYNDTKYLIKAKIFDIMSTWTIYNSKNEEVFYCKQKFSLRTDIHIFTDKSKQEKALTVKTKNIIDICSTYDIIDDKMGIKIGSVKENFKSLFSRNEWTIKDKDGREIGKIQEDSLILALLRRYILGRLIPATYYIFIGTKKVAIFKKLFRLIGRRTSLDFSLDTENLFDKRIGIAAALLLCTVTGDR